MIIMETKHKPKSKRIRRAATSDIYLIGIDEDVLEGVRDNKIKTGVPINKFMELAAKEKLISQGWKPKSKK